MMDNNHIRLADHRRHERIRSLVGEDLERRQAVREFVDGFAQDVAVDEGENWMENRDPIYKAWRGALEAVAAGEYETALVLALLSTSPRTSSAIAMRELQAS